MTTKVPILVEFSDVLRKRLDGFVNNLKKTGVDFSFGAVEINESISIQTAIKMFDMDLDKGIITQESILQWEKDYREHRSAPRKRTNITVNEEASNQIMAVANKVTKVAPSLRHVYHGGAVNNKLIIFLAVSSQYFRATD